MKSSTSQPGKIKHGFGQFAGLTKKFFLNTVRDRPLLIWTFGYPLLIILIFSGAFSASSGNFQYDLAVINYDAEPIAGQNSTSVISAYGQSMINAFNNESLALNSTFRVYYSLNESVAREYVNTQDIHGVLILPANFSETIMGGDNVTYELYLTNDPSANFIISSVIQKAVAQLISNATYAIDVDVNAPLMNLSNRDYLFPAMALGAVIVSIMTVASLFAQEKEKGLLQRLDTTPVPRAMHFLAGGVSQMTVNAIQTVIMLVVIALLGMQVHPNANWGLAFLSIWIFSLICLGIGLILAAFVKTSSGAGGAAWLFILPLQAFGGVFNIQFPENITRFVPTSYGVRAVRDVLINGLGLQAILPDILICLAMGVGLIALGIVFFTRKTSV